MANGRFTARNPETEFAKRRTILATLAERFEVSPDAVALAAALARPWADVVLSNAATQGQLESNLWSLEVSWDEDMESNVRSLAEEPEAYSPTGSNLAWN